MKKICMFFFLLSFLLFGSVAFSMTSFHDDFDSYTVGTFPTEGGWQLKYAGAGAQYQYVDDTYSVSPPYSLHLRGSGCWSATAYRPVEITEQVTYKTKILIEHVTSPGCTPAMADVGLYNPAIGTWGTHYARISFQPDGWIRASVSTYPFQCVDLMPYITGHWYEIEVEADFISRTFNVIIDGTMVGESITFLDSGLPTSIVVDAGHGANPEAWFDVILRCSLPQSPLPHST